MDNYYFCFRRLNKFYSFWKKFKVIGHKFEKDQDKMVIYFPDGSVQEIAFWSHCEVKLGTDWVLTTKKSMERQAGQTIPTNF